MSVRDGRLPPFTWQSVAALCAIHARFDGRKEPADGKRLERSTALAIYVALTWIAFEGRHRSRPGLSFEAPRPQVAEAAGVSVRSLDRYAAIFETELGLLKVERRRKGRLNLPNIWTLVEPGGGATSAPPWRNQSARGGATSAPGGGATSAPQLQERRMGKEGPPAELARVTALPTRRRRSYDEAVRRG